MSGRLQEAIEGAGMTRYAIAKGSGVEQSALSRFVRRERTLSLDAVDALAVFLGWELVPSKRRARAPRDGQKGGDK